MDKVGEGPQGGKQPAPPAASPRSGASGEGLRSLMEQLIQQQRKRDAQLPRDGRDPPAPAPKR
jgi:hypothetical protein